MAITDLNTLRQTAERWSAGSSDPNFSDAVVDAIGICESTLNRRLMTAEQIKRVVFSVTGTDWTDLPADLRAVAAVHYVTEAGQGKDVLLAPATQGNIAALRDRCGSGPGWYALSGLQIAIAPAAADETYALRLIYYAAVPALSATSPCTAVLLRYPDLYLYGTLASLEGYLVNDPRIETWKGQFEAELLMANRAAARRTTA